ncbi:MAG: metallophosphoesterase [Candidatus Zixiibacteriota bacterium]
MPEPNDTQSTIDLVRFPSFASDRGWRYWLNPRNLWAARYQRLRADYSIDWRRAYPYDMIPSEFCDINGPGTRSTPFAALLGGERRKFRFLVLGDTGEGDRSQYCLLPLIHALAPDFMIINGDVAYPAGRFGPDRNSDDYLAGFFEPYRGLDIPIWAVPGNHEYYSDRKGQEFFELFCTRARERDWAQYGLRLIPQPGTYWELKDAKLRNDLVVIGIDSGRGANLDGHHSWWQVWKRRESPDREQLSWLCDRLGQAEIDDQRVIVMFHIPALVNERDKSDIHLGELHKMLAAFSCVRLVITAHTHNYQQYGPSVFGDYLKRVHGTAFETEPPHYIMSGRGGAYLNATDFDDGQFRSDFRYPTKKQWGDRMKNLSILPHVQQLEKSMVGRMVALFDRDSIYDMDTEEFLSMLLVDVDRTQPTTSVTVTPVCLDGLSVLYGENPTTDIDITDPNPPLLSGALNKCLRNEFAITI